MSSRRKGSEKERNLANLFWQYNCAVLRGCSSGGGVRKRYVPDIVAICRGSVLVFEVKYRNKTSSIRLDANRVSKLLEFANRSGGRAYLLFKFGRGPWKIFPIDGPEDVHVNREVYEKAQELSLFLYSIYNKKLDLYI